MIRIIQITGLTNRDFDADEIIEMSVSVADALRNPAKGWHAENSFGFAPKIRLVINENPDLYTTTNCDAWGPLIDWDAGIIDVPKLSLNHKMTFKTIEVTQ